MKQVSVPTKYQVCILFLELLLPKKLCDPAGSDELFMCTQPEAWSDQLFLLFVISKHWKELQKWIFKTLSSSNHDKGLRKAHQLNMFHTTESVPATFQDDCAAAA